jgi:hypothetical protein
VIRLVSIAATTIATASAIRPMIASRPVTFWIAAARYVYGLSSVTSTAYGSRAEPWTRYSGLGQIAGYQPEADPDVGLGQGVGDQVMLAVLAELEHDELVHDAVRGHDRVAGPHGRLALGHEHDVLAHAACPRLEVVGLLLVEVRAQAIDDEQAHEAERHRDHRDEGERQPPLEGPGRELVSARRTRTRRHGSSARRRDARGRPRACPGDG